jgi:hypothetical protein
VEVCNRKLTFSCLKQKVKIMRSRIEKRDGYVYEVVGSKKGFETYYNLGKDPDEVVEQPVVEQPKPKKKKIEIAENVVENEKEPSVD